MNENNRPSYTRMIAVSGIMGAITVLLLLTPLGMMPWFSGASLTFMQVPTIIAAILEGPIAGLIVGAIFGVSSLLKSAIAPNSIFDPLFVNPLISVIPRLLIGPVSYFVYKALKGKESAPRITLGAIVASIAGSLTNTCLVLPLLKLFADLQKIAGLTWPVVGGIALVNGLPEAGFSAFIATATVLSWKAITVGRSKARLADEDGSKG
jgi:uncharacterized membrane protein